jgi:hypothetical protein
MRRRRRRLTSKSATALSLFPSLDGLLLRSSQQLAQRLLDGSWHFSDERWLDEPRTEYDERRWSSCGAASCSEGKTARPGVGQRLGEIQLRRSRCAACDNCSTGVGTFRTNVGSMSHEQNTMRGAGAVAAPLLARYPRNARRERLLGRELVRGSARYNFGAAAAQLATL